MYHCPGFSPAARSGCGWKPLTRLTEVTAPRPSRVSGARRNCEPSNQEMTVLLPLAATAGRTTLAGKSRRHSICPLSLSTNATDAPAFSSSQATKQPSDEQAKTGVVFFPSLAELSIWVWPRKRSLPLVFLDGTSPVFKLGSLSAMRDKYIWIRSKPRLTENARYRKPFWTATVGVAAP